MKPSYAPSLDAILSGLRTFLAALITAWPALLCAGLVLNGAMSGCHPQSDNIPAATSDAGLPAAGRDLPLPLPPVPDLSNSDAHQPDPPIACPETNLLMREVTRLQDSLSQTCRPSGAMVHLTTTVTAPVPGGAKGRTPVPVSACNGKLTLQLEKLDLKRRNVSLSVFPTNETGLSPRAMPLDPGMEADRSLWLKAQGLVLQVKSCQAAGCEVECLEWSPAPLPPGCDSPIPAKE